jgi:hypothetical protein
LKDFSKFIAKPDKEIEFLVDNTGEEKQEV